MSTNDMQDTNAGNRPDTVTISPEAALPPEPESVVVPFFNLANDETEHCFAWFIGSGVIDPVVLIEQARQRAAEEFDDLPADEKADRDRDKVIEEDMLEKLIEAIEELFEDQLDEVLPGNWDVVALGETCMNDPEILVKGLAACGWGKVSREILAQALLLHVANLAVDDGGRSHPNIGKEG